MPLIISVADPLPMLGATVVSIGMALILIIFTFGIKPIELIDNMINALNGRDREQDEEYDDYKNAKKSVYAKVFDALRKVIDKLG